MIVRRSEWPTTTLKDGDQIEIVHFVGGGNGDGSDLRDHTAREVAKKLTTSQINANTRIKPAPSILAFKPNRRARDENHAIEASG